jgi:hypothetical protein
MPASNPFASKVDRDFEEQERALESAGAAIAADSGRFAEPPQGSGAPARPAPKPRAKSQVKRNQESAFDLTF